MRTQCKGHVKIRRLLAPCEAARGSLRTPLEVVAAPDSPPVHRLLEPSPLEPSASRDESGLRANMANSVLTCVDRWDQPQRASEPAPLRATDNRSYDLRDSLDLGRLPELLPTQLPPAAATLHPDHVGRG